VFDLEVGAEMVVRRGRIERQGGVAAGEIPTELGIVAGGQP
jgi:hypothetical protein